VTAKRVSTKTNREREEEREREGQKHPDDKGGCKRTNKTKASIERDKKKVQEEDTRRRR
jgi:hypothetical protein